MDSAPPETKNDDRTTVACDMTVSREFDEAVSVFLGARSRLFEIVYRVLGSLSEADDIVQEAWLRWQRTDRSVVRNPTAFLATMTTRLALNLAQSARSRRESYADPGTLERADPGIGPEAWAERGEAVEHAVSLLLGSLTPTEWAAYVLREAFDYPYQQIAEMLPITTAHARQLVRRARQRLDAERRRPVHPAVHRRFVLAFRTASRAGNLTDLTRLLAADVAS